MKTYLIKIRIASKLTTTMDTYTLQKETRLECFKEAIARIKDTFSKGDRVYVSITPTNGDN